MVIVVNLAVQQPLHRIDDPAATHECTVDVALELVADRKTDDAPVAVAPAGGLIRELAIGPRDLAEQVNLLAVKKMLDDQIAIALKLRMLLIAQDEGHGHSLSMTSIRSRGAVLGTRPY